QTLETAYANAQAQAQDATAGSAFAASPTSKLATAIGQDPIQQTLSTEASSSASSAASALSSAFAGTVSTYQKLAKIRPNDPSVQLELAQTAAAAGNAPVAIAAYKRVAKLEPAQAAQVNAIVKQLQKASG